MGWRFFLLFQSTIDWYSVPRVLIPWIFHNRAVVGLSSIPEWAYRLFSSAIELSASDYPVIKHLIHLVTVSSVYCLHYLDVYAVAFLFVSVQCDTLAQQIVYCQTTFWNAFLENLSTKHSVNYITWPTTLSALVNIIKLTQPSFPQFVPQMKLYFCSFSLPYI